MATLTNIALNARSMNGVIVISDGGGTIIEDGTVDTDNLITETMTSTNMISTNMIVPRVNAALVPSLGANINLTTLTQNMNFNTTAARQFEIWNDQATGQILVVDVSNNVIDINTINMNIVTDTALNFASPSITFTNSGVSFPNSTVSFNSYLPTSTLTPSTGNQLITKTYGDSTYPSLTGANTFTDLNKFNKFFLNPTISNASTINWAFTDNNFMMLTYTGGTITFNLPTPTTADIGKQLHILLYYTSVSITFVAPIGKNFNDDVNADVPSKTYNSNVRFFSFTAIATSFALWKMSAFQGITRNYADATYQPVGSYGTLNGANAWTSTNTFNTSIPTTSLTPSADNQFITRVFADGRYGELATSNIFTAQNEFRNGILPCRGATTNAQTDIQIGGNNQFQYRQAASQYNIGIGALTIQGDSVVAGQVNNIGKRNIGIGHQSLFTGDNINDCIAIGYQAMQNCGSIRVYTVATNRAIAIGNGAIQNGIYGQDNIAIGTNALKNCSSGNGSVVIAHNGGTGLTSQGSVVIIGSEAAPTIADNGFVCVGYRTAGFATGQANRCVFVGEQAGLYNSNAYSNTMVGGLAGKDNTVGSQNTCLGAFAGGNGSINNSMNSVAIGCNAQYTDSWEFVIGGDDTLGGALSYPRLTLPTKNRINCCQFTGTPTTFTINWRTNEYVVVNSATCTQINLPQAISSNQNRVGAAFHICRTHLATSNLIIAAFGTEKISWKGSLVSSVPIDSWVMSISFVCVDNVAGNGVWSVFTYNDRVTLATDANRIQTISDSANVAYPVCFTTIATTGYNEVYANSSLTYNPSTSSLTVPNLTVSGTLNATINPVFPVITVNNIYKPNSTAFIGSNDTVLPGLPTLYGFYFWTDSNPSGVPDTVITLPQLTTDMDGCKLTFRRIAYQGSPFVPRQLVIKTPTALFGGLSQLIVARDSATTILAGTNYVLLTTAVSRLGAFASLVVRQNVWYVID